MKVPNADGKPLTLAEKVKLNEEYGRKVHPELYADDGEQDVADGA
jgi:hypothetical protein